jgi:hypothetical protein
MSVRALTDEEVFLPTRWAAAEGWNPGHHDFSVFQAADPGSLLTVETEGGPAGVITALRVTPNYGFLGCFVLDPCVRGKRWAAILWHAALERMEGRTIGLEGVLERQHNYARWDFAPAERTTCQCGVAPTRPAPWAGGIEPASRTPLADLAAYDAAGYGAPRAAALVAWLTLPERRALVFKREGRLRGFGVIRRCQTGVRIGPLMADDPEAAEALFDALAGFAPGEPLQLDTPEPNRESVKLARRRGLEPVVTVIRMYRGTPPKRSLDQVYGLTSFAMG